MNIEKYIAPDFRLGKLILVRKAVVDAIMMIVRNPTPESLRLIKLIFQVKPHYTMATNKSLVKLYHLAQKINSLDLPGDIVECGVWNGGSAAVMAVACMENRHAVEHRAIWLFDSFQGLPPPGENDGNFEKELYFEGWNKGDVKKVKHIFTRLGLPREKLNIVPGWFDTTLNGAPIDRIALLNIDADWYESVKLVLDVFYEKVVPGGFVVLDDYGWWQGCDRAVTDYFMEHGITNVVIERIDRRGGAYFQKPL